MTKICTLCKKEYPAERIVRVSDTQELCWDCRNKGSWHRCDACDKWYQGTLIDLGEAMAAFCDECLAEDFIRCESCGALRDRDYASDYVQLDDGTWLCAKCAKARA